MDQSQVKDEYQSPRQDQIKRINNCSSPPNIKLEHKIAKKQYRKNKK